MSTYDIKNGVTSTGITLNIYDKMYVSYGGTTNNTTVNGGNITIYSGGTANSTNVNSNGNVYVSSGGTANSTMVNSGGWLYVSSGGTATTTTVNSRGYLHVSSGGTATGIVENGGCVSIENPAQVTFVANEFSDLELYGTATVHSGTTANNTTVNGGYLHVYSGGTATTTTVNSRGHLHVSSGGTANSTTVNSGGWLYVSSGGIANNTIINHDLCDFYVEAGGTANSTTLNGVGYLGQRRFVCLGSINNTIINRGELLVCSGGVANSTTVNSDRLYVFSGGTANDTTVNSNGWFDVSSGGTANSTTVNSGYLFVSSGGTAKNTTVNSGGSLCIYSGGTALQIIENGGYVDNADGAHISFVANTLSELVLIGPIENYYAVCRATVHSGTTAHGTTINSGGRLYVFSSGIAISTTVYGNGELSVSSGGIASNIKVYAGGTVRMANNAKMTGKMNLSGGAVIFVENGTIVDFNLTQTAAGGKALLTDWSLLQGRPDYTLTVNDNQANGVYALADGAEDFDGTISVQNAAGESFGTLTVGEMITVGDNKYTLSINEESLILSITGSGPADTKAPTVSSIKASTTKPTSQSVTVTATFKDNIEVAQALYRIGETGAWTTYENGVTVTENGTIYFKAVDTSGNESQIASFKVTNIIKNDPVPPVEEGVFAPDTRNDGWLYDKKTKKLNEGVTDSSPVKITTETGEILFDEAESVSHEEKGKAWRNFVGKGKVDNEAVVDDADFVKISLDNPAKLSFSVEATNATKFTVYSLVAGTDKNGNATHTMKALQTTALKKDKSTGLYSTTTKVLLLERTEDDRDYYISMQSTNKKAESVFYNVSLVTEGDKASRFYADADEGDNNWLYDKKTKKRNETVAESDAAHVNSGTVAVQIDAEGTGLDEWGNFVGFGDNADHAKITLDHAARLRFTINAADAAKFVIYSLTPGKNDTYTMKALQTTALKKVDSAKYEVTTKNLLLAAGDYYVSVQSTNAKKGGGAYYNVTLNQESIFFSDGDNGDNNWLYDKKSKELNDEVVYRDPIEITPYTERVQVDAEAAGHEDANGTVWDNYVGYGDEYDFARIRLQSDARLNITITATDAAKFTVYALIEKVDSWTGIVSYKLETIQSSALKKAKGDSVYRYSVTMMVPGYVNYYVSMQSTNAAKGGCAYYNVEINQKKSSFDDMYLYAPSESPASALAMPEAGGFTEDELFAGLELNSAQEASLSAVGSGLESAQDMLFGTDGVGILASL